MLTRALFLHQKQRRIPCFLSSSSDNRFLVLCSPKNKKRERETEHQKFGKTKGKRDKLFYNHIQTISLDLSPSLSVDLSLFLLCQILQVMKMGASLQVIPAKKSTSSQKSSTKITSLAPPLSHHCRRGNHQPRRKEIYREIQAIKFSFSLFGNQMFQNSPILHFIQAFTERLMFSESILEYMFQKTKFQFHSKRSRPVKLHESTTFAFLTN